MARLLQVTFDAVELQVDTVSSAAVAVTVDVQRATGRALGQSVYMLIMSLSVVVVYFMAKKRLRLSGMEPEANIPALILEDPERELGLFRLPVLAAAMTELRKGDVIFVRRVRYTNLHIEELHAIWKGWRGPPRPVVVRTENGPMRNWFSKVTFCTCDDHLRNGPGCLHGWAVFNELVLKKGECGDAFQLLDMKPYAAWREILSIGPVESSVAVRKAAAVQGESTSEGLRARSLGCYSYLELVKQKVTKFTERRRLAQAQERETSSSASAPAVTAPPSASVVSVPTVAPGVARVSKPDRRSGSIPRAMPPVMSAKFLAGEAFQNYFAEVLIGPREARVEELCFVAFSLDAKNVLAAICGLPPGANRRVLVDKRQTFHDSGTKHQYAGLKQLQSAGVVVKIGEGTSVQEGYNSRGRSTGVGTEVMGRVHAKSSYFRLSSNSGGPREWLFIGSCNWTDASVCNYEASVVIVNPPFEMVSEWKTVFETHWARAGTLDEVAETEHRRSQRSPTRRTRHWE